MGEPSLDDANVKVAVRVRPMNRRGEGVFAMILGLLLIHKHSDQCFTRDCICQHDSGQHDGHIKPTSRVYSQVIIMTALK